MLCGKNYFLASVTNSEQPAAPQVTCMWVGGVLELFLQLILGDFTTAPLQGPSSTKHPGWMRAVIAHGLALMLSSFWL